LTATIHHDDYNTSESVVLIIDRIKGESSPVIELQNDDAILTTTARIDQEGESFIVNITIPFGTGRVDSAIVTVSSELGKLIEDRARQNIV